MPKISPESEDIATVDEISEHLDITPQTVLRIYKNNPLKQEWYDCLVIGTFCEKNKISKEDLLEFVQIRNMGKKRKRSKK